MRLAASVVAPRFAAKSPFPNIPRFQRSIGRSAAMREFVRFSLCNAENRDCRVPLLAKPLIDLAKKRLQRLCARRARRVRDELTARR